MNRHPGSLTYRKAAGIISLVMMLLLLAGCSTVETGGTAVFDLADHIDGDSFDLRAPLQQAGSPSFTVENGALRIGNRSASWHALDLIRDYEASPLQVGDTVTIEGTIINAPAGSVMILGGAESPWNWITSMDVEGTQSYFLQTVLTEQHFSDAQFVRLRLQTNETGANSDFTVSKWTVTRAGGAAAAPAAEAEPAAAEPVDPATAEAVLIYSLESDPYILENNGPTDLEEAEFLALSGTPTAAINGTSIELTNRVQNWYTVDVLFEPLGLEMGGSYRFRASGTAPAGTEIGWHRAEAPWTYVTQLVRTDASGNWTIEAIITYPVIPAMPGLRIQTNAAPEVDVTVNSVEVYHLIGASSESTFRAPEWDLTLPSLKDLFAPYFRMGNIYSTPAIMSQFGTDEAYRYHFNAVTAENGHKPDGIVGPGSRLTHPSPAEFNFTQADAIVDWAIENGQELIGHALVWHSQTPQWLFSSAPGTPLSRDEALENMEYYIKTLAAHWEERGVIDRFYSWDVVNEAISNDGGSWGGALDDWNAGDWRAQLRTDSGWYRAFANGSNAAAGEHPSDFIFYAFYFARKYFPSSVLYYNDYNEEIPAKRNAIGQMVEQINERWEAHPEYDGRLLIEGIGLQSHYHLRGWTTNLDNVKLALERFIATGAEISVTELDITVGGYGGPAPSESELPALLEEQAEAYAKLFSYYLEHAEHIHRVSFWGLADTQSWRAPGRPLPFDGLFNAKPAFHAIVDTVRNFRP